MKRMLDAKKKYEETEIPQDLSSRVAEAIAKSSPKKRSFAFYTKRVLAPIAVCAAICVVVGLGFISGQQAEDAAIDNEGISLARAVPEAKMTKGAPVADEADLYELSYDEYISKKAEKGCLPLKKPIQMTFTAGAFGWDSYITLNPDGTFEGDYHDSDMGVAAEEYPYGTLYVCTFKGKFDNIKKLDKNTYTMTLSELEYDTTEPEEYIKDGIRHIKSTPHGIIGGKEFVFYLPDASPSVLTEEEKWWWHYGYGEDEAESLHACGLINKETAQGFFSYIFRDR